MVSWARKMAQWLKATKPNDLREATHTHTHTALDKRVYNVCSAMCKSESFSGISFKCTEVRLSLEE